MKLKNCPFCGNRVDISDPDVFHPSTVGWLDNEIEGVRTYHSFREVPRENWCYVINCAEVLGGCSAEIMGDDKKETIKKWNRRAKK